MLYSGVFFMKYFYINLVLAPIFLDIWHVVFCWVCFVAVKVWEENLETKGLDFVFCCIGNQYT